MGIIEINNRTAYTDTEMDILDQLTTSKTSKKPQPNTSSLTLPPKPTAISNIDQKRTSIMQHNRSPSPTDSNNLSSNIYIAQSKQKQNKFEYKPRNQVHASYQHLRHAHFDISNHSAPNNIKPMQSTFTIAQPNLSQNNQNNQNTSLPRSRSRDMLMSQNNSGNNNISNRWGFNVESASLGVIVSEDSSEDRDSKNSVHATASGRDNAMPIIKNISQLEHTQLQNKHKTLQSEQAELKIKIDSLQSELTAKNAAIAELNQKLENQAVTFREQRRNIIQQMQQAHIKQMQKVKASMNEEIIRRDELNKWDAQNRNNAYKMELQMLKGVINNYQKLLHEQQHVTKQRNNLQVKQQRVQKQLKIQQQKLTKKQHQLTIKYRNLQQKQHKFYKDKRDHDAAVDKINKQLDQQRIKIKRDRLHTMEQLQSKYQLRQNQLSNKVKEYEDKLRKVEMKEHQLEMMQAILAKQKDECSKISQKCMSEYKTNMQKISEQRERVHYLQQQLYKKIQTVQMYSKKQPLFSASIPRPQSACKSNFLAIPQQDNSEAISMTILPPNMSEKQHNLQILTNGNNKQNESIKKLQQTSKINVSSYIGRMSSTAKETKCKGRPIYRLHEHFN